MAINICIDIPVTYLPGIFFTLQSFIPSSSKFTS